MLQKLLMCGGVGGGSESYTTPGTYYWTAPAGATEVDVTGRGGSEGTETTWYSGETSFLFMIGGIYLGHPSGAASYDASATNLGTSLTYEQAETIGSTYLSQWSSITTNSAGANYNNMEYSYINYDGTNWLHWQPLTHYAASPGPLFRRTGTPGTTGNLKTATGTIPTTSPYGSHSTSYLDVTKKLYVTNIERGLVSSVDGANSTAFSRTFSAGGSQSTVANISVNAGTQYTIVVGADEGSDTAFISFDYR